MQHEVPGTERLFCSERRVGTWACAVSDHQWGRKLIKASQDRRRAASHFIQQWEGTAAGHESFSRQMDKSEQLLALKMVKRCMFWQSGAEACNLQPRLKLPRAGSLLELPHVWTTVIALPL